MSVLWSDGIVAQNPKVIGTHYFRIARGDPIEGSTTHHENMMRLGSQALLDAMMRAPRVRA